MPACGRAQQPCRAQEPGRAAAGNVGRATARGWRWRRRRCSQPAAGGAKGGPSCPSPLGMALTVSREHGGRDGALLGCGAEGAEPLLPGRRPGGGAAGPQAAHAGCDGAPHCAGMGASRSAAQGQQGLGPAAPVGCLAPRVDASTTPGHSTAQGWAPGAAKSPGMWGPCRRCARAGRRWPQVCLAPPAALSLRPLLHAGGHLQHASGPRPAPSVASSLGAGLTGRGAPPAGSATLPSPPSQC